MNVRRRTKPFVKGNRNRTGAVVVEFAIIAPVLILMVMGALDVGQSVNVAQVVNDASREGARQASRTNCVSDYDVELAVRTYLEEAFPGVPPSDLYAAMTVNVSSSANPGIVGGDMTALESGSTVTVQVILEYDAVRWITGIPGFSGITIETSTMMRRD